MKIMVDANIIVSALLFKNSVVSKVLTHVIDNNILTISQYTIDEVKDVFYEKFPHKVDEMNEFLKKLPYEIFVLNKIDSGKYPSIRDIDDLPVLANAIESKVDILITGDKDFDDIKIEKPKIIKPRKYIDEYLK